MQKGDQKKLTMLLAGISARMRQNKTYFVSAEMEFQSGSKRFAAKLLPVGQDWELHFQGVTRAVTAENAAAFFAEKAAAYEEATWTYIERGNMICITCTPRGVQMKQGEPTMTPVQSDNPLLDSGRQYMVRIDKAAALLREIGILTANGKLKNDMIRKYNQIDHYVELVAPMFEKVDDEEILILDCACGKSYLSFVMNYYLREVMRRRCRIIGIDINEHVVQESRRMAQRLGYHNMEFQTADLRKYCPPPNVTGVISLHACDIATDLALATAIRAQAKLIACVPCCHKELLDQFQLPQMSALIRHGVFKARFNDFLTDSLRVLRLEAEGYKVSVVEYISPLDTPKNLLIRASRAGNDNQKAREEYYALTKLLGTCSELDRRCADIKSLPKI